MSFVHQPAEMQADGQKREKEKLKYYAPQRGPLILYLIREGAGRPTDNTAD